MKIYRKFRTLLITLLIFSFTGNTLSSDFHIPLLMAKEYPHHEISVYSDQNAVGEGIPSATTVTPAAITTPGAIITPSATTSGAIGTPSVTDTANPAATTTPVPVSQSAMPLPSPTEEPEVQALYIEYLGKTLTESTLLDKKDFLVTAAYPNNITKTITDYEFISSTYIDKEGDTQISVSYKGKSASCTVSYVKDNTKQYYNIHFESNGGSEVYPILSILPGSNIRLPQAPTRYGYWFRGWYTDASFYNEFDTNTRILQDYTLYAKWQEKDNPDDDTMSTYLIYDLFDSFFCKLTVDLSEQNYGSNTIIDAEPIDNQTVKDAAKNISSTKNYFAFHLDIMDCSFQENHPVPVTISVPPEFNETTTQVFYSPDEKQILGACQGSFSGSFNYTFYAYHAGTYIVMDVPEIEPTATPTSTVKPSISISLASSVNVNAQKNAQIKFKNFDEDIQAPEEISFSWKSSNPKIATVSKDGIVTGIKAGTVKITVTSEDKNYTASATIKVIGKSVKIKSLSLNKTKLSLKKGKSFQIKATIKPSNATNKTLKYTSSNKNIASVSSKGKITAKKPGKCVITVKTTDGSGLTKKITVTVKK